MGKPLREIQDENILSPSPQQAGYCPICESKLVFEYQTDYLSNSVEEVAFCETCCCQISKEEHQVQ